MSKNKTVRTGLLGSAAVFALLAVSPAQAVEAQFGDVSITFDTTVSMGASMLVAERNNAFLPEATGGTIDPRADLSLGAVIVGTRNTVGLASFGNTGAGFATVGTNIYTNNGFNNDGSANTDDGRLNFDRGDLIGANVKATHELQVVWQNYKLFARGVGFYDVIMNDKNAGAHSQMTDQGLGDVGRNYELLDLFVSADYTLGDLPLNLRVGKQVINWGESTFIQNGLNAFNPIDVAAIRKPGSEIKEALVPVNAVFGSISFPFQVSMSGWYALDWEPFEIDPSGAPFSTADVVAQGSGVGGNQMFSWVTASPYGGNRRNCSASATAGTKVVQTNGLLNDPLALGSALGNNLLECSDSPWIDMTARPPNDQFELIRIGQSNGTGGQIDLRGDGVTEGTTALLFRGEDYKPRDGGQYGLKATWFSEDLNGTEFGFYYQNYHSRLPFVQVEAKTGATSGELSFFLNSGNTEITTGVTSRQLNNLGCSLTSPALVGGIAGAAGATMNGTIAFGLSASAQTQLKNTPVSDPGNVLQNAMTTLIGLSGGTMVPFDSDPGVGVNYKNQYNITLLNCALTYYQSGFVTPPGAAAPTVQTFDGSEFVLGNANGQLSVVYPEDIEQYGFSFNTTLGSMGLQGEMSYRPSAPFQVDTDSLTIASLVEGCTFEMLYGAAGPIVDGLATPDGSGVKPGCGGEVHVANPIIRNEMFTAQIGTTSQMTGSDWFIDMIGADIGTVVTEVGLVYTPSVEDTWVNNLSAAKAAATPQYANTGCQGTDLPGGGILGLDGKSSAACRPTDLSAGMVFLFTVQYNNFLDSGFAVSPRIVYSYDFEGTTAAPYGNYMEDRQALNLGIDGTLNNNLRLGVSYSNFFGGHINNKSSDRDFASVSASYTF
ncbi:MAG: DUF1302 family protein [Micropepsaceae bacterium]